MSSSFTAFDAGEVALRCSREPLNEAAAAIGPKQSCDSGPALGRNAGSYVAQS